MSDEKLNEINNAVRKIADTSDGNGSGNRRKRKHLIFRLAAERYGMPLSRVKEVIAMVNITPIPHVPAFYKGMINLRGQIISVIDLRTKLRVLDAKLIPKKTSIIISHVGDILVGAIVDEVLEVIGYEDEQINTMEAERIQRNGDGVYGIAKDVDENLTLLIDIEKALDKTEFKVLKNQAA